MFSKLQTIFSIPELRRRILFTLGMLAVYRVGCHVPLPGVDRAVLAQFFQGTEGTLLGLVSSFTGGALERMTVFALGIMPYISASIILQLLTVVFEPVERLAKEGEQGRKKLTRWTRYGTVVLSIIQGTGIAIGRSFIPIEPDRPQRCAAYVPGSGDADRRSGRERWPWLIAPGATSR